MLVLWDQYHHRFESIVFNSSSSCQNTKARDMDGDTVLYRVNFQIQKPTHHQPHFHMPATTQNRTRPPPVQVHHILLSSQTSDHSSSSAFTLVFSCLRVNCSSLQAFLRLWLARHENISSPVTRGHESDNNKSPSPLSWYALVLIRQTDTRDSSDEDAAITGDSRRYRLSPRFVL